MQKSVYQNMTKFRSFDQNDLEKSPFGHFLMVFIVKHFLTFICDPVKLNNSTPDRREAQSKYFVKNCLFGCYRINAWMRQVGVIEKVYFAVA